jgi:hypothetical protein
MKIKWNLDSDHQLYVSANYIEESLMSTKFRYLPYDMKLNMTCGSTPQLNVKKHCRDGRPGAACGLELEALLTRT